MRVGVFDSGLGGLSIMSAIRTAIPSANLAYCCDNFNFPYGTKADTEVLGAALDVTGRFFQQTQMDVMVIACNTASVLALEAIRKKLPIPVVGVVPAVKPAAQASKTKFIGVLATPVTIRRPYLEELLKNFASDCKVAKVGSSRLVTIAENKIRCGISADIEEIRAEVLEIINAAAEGLDQLVLGCTHFPLIVEELQKVLPAQVQLVDSGEAIAGRVKVVLEQLGYLNNLASTGGYGEIQGYCSGESFEIAFPATFKVSDRKFKLLKLS